MNPVYNFKNVRRKFLSLKKKKRIWTLSVDANFGNLKKVKLVMPLMSKNKKKNYASTLTLKSKKLVILSITENKKK